MKTTIIKAEDLIQSIADAVQYISYYHPTDFIEHLSQAYDREESPAARDALAQILSNSRMSAFGHRPMCQDTGGVNIVMEMGIGVGFDRDLSLHALWDEGSMEGDLIVTKHL